MAGRESSKSVPKRRSKSKGNSCSDIFLTLAFVAFGATTCFYTVQFVFISICQLIEVMKFHLVIFGVQIFPFLSIDKLPQLSYLSYLALPWGLAALGVFTGSKLLLVPIQICKIQLAYITIRVAAMNWESNFNPQIVAMASIASFQLAFILLVFIVMACASSHRPLFYDYIATGGKDDVQLRKVKINMARRVEEGEVEAKPRSRNVEVERMQALLWKKEEQLLAALVAAEQGVSAEDGVTVETPTAPTESQGIYPVLGSPTSPV